MNPKRSLLFIARNDQSQADLAVPALLLTGEQKQIVIYLFGQFPDDLGKTWSVPEIEGHPEIGERFDLAPEIFLKHLKTAGLSGKLLKMRVDSGFDLQFEFAEICRKNDLVGRILPGKERAVTKMAKGAEMFFD